VRADLREYLAPGSPEEALARSIDFARLPRHVAIIMDGNGRWAAKRMQPRVFGHRAGIESVRETVEASARIGLDVLTLFAFSRENWKRPAAEVETLFSLLREYVRKEIDFLDRQDIRFRVVGRLQDLPRIVQDDLLAAVERTSDNRGMIFNVALSYGSRTEIVDACNAILERVARGELKAPVDEDAFARFLYTEGLPDPDLLIRTSGENRLSNFLLWQGAYAELWITETLWPDFRRGDLLRAIVDFQRRERRYGGV
jgi:undecaprenyl diphosphate synthase